MLAPLNVNDIILAPQTTKHEQVFGPSLKLPLFKRNSDHVCEKEKREKNPKVYAFFGIPVLQAWTSCPLSVHAHAEMNLFD